MAQIAGPALPLIALFSMRTPALLALIRTFGMQSTERSLSSYFNAPGKAIYRKQIIARLQLVRSGIKRAGDTMECHRSEVRWVNDFMPPLAKTLFNDSRRCKTERKNFLCLQQVHSSKCVE
jgi:hypothetical protein